MDSNFQIKFHIWRITPLRAMSAVGQFQVWSLFPARTPSFSREQLQDGSVRNLTTYHSCYNLEKKLGRYFMCCTNMIKESHVFVKCKPCHINTIYEIYGRGQDSYFFCIKVLITSVRSYLHQEKHCTVCGPFSPSNVYVGRVNKLSRRSKVRKYYKNANTFKKMRKNAIR